MLVRTPKSRPTPILKNTKSVLKNVVQTAKREWKKRPAGAPTVRKRDRTASREREGAGTFKTPTLVRRERTSSKEREGASSLRIRRSRAEADRRTVAEAERIWQEATTEEDNNRSITMRAASLERLETESRTGSILNESREGGELNFIKKVCDENK